ncbi:ubiquitin carboxyl-terminal hydrolase CYLD [Osmerus mordax]|uniref:ubiquitin carboxyl-terminal hydrolase CYLD n=1 Tax=Osmerus mordax TaxID=8014 RepID=UPI00351004B7
MNSGTDGKTYYITTDKCKTISAGHICYLSENRTRKKDSNEVPVICIDNSGLDSKMKTSILEEITVKEAELLQALKDNAERLKWFREEAALHTALGLTKDTPVTVEGEKKKKLKGVIRYIGRITDPKYPDPIAGTFFGIELQDKGKGNTDGTIHSKTLFSCSKDSGMFAPFSKVRPLTPILPAPAPQSSPQSFATGDRVTFFLEDEENGRHGMAMGLEEKQGRRHVFISTDTNEKGEKGGEVWVPIECVIKEALLPESDAMDVNVPEVPKREGHIPDLGVDSLVQIHLGTGPAYGTIRWIGDLPDLDHTRAGIELEDSIGVSDGTFKGRRLFQCLPHHGLFVKLASCHPDSRFGGAPEGGHEREAEHSLGMLGNVDPVSSEQVGKILVGRMKGIQGHCNSCYMDSALFSLFSCTSVLDSLLFKSTETRDAPIQNTLLHDIVNPLRSKGFVEGKHIMKLRQQLQDRGYCHSYTTEEKDPEEFLSLIMHQILCLEPLLKISAGGKVQESYCYQIFLDHNHSLVLPTVQQLLEHSFHSSALRLAEVPSCVILQMPRFGKKFKMFEKIIPSLELDITHLLSDGPQQCVMCGQLAQEECVDCFRDQVFSRTGFKLFCKTCSKQVHSHPQRSSHQRSALCLPEGFPGRAPGRPLPRETLELFAVLCIETSHYVSFIKHGPNKTDWIFFDSMADRQGEIDGFNIPQVQACPEVAVYLDMPLAELANQVPRDMKGVAKRLFCDAYMYLYQSSNMMLYC